LERLEKDAILTVRNELDLWEYISKVLPIVKDVKERKEYALKEYVKRFDGYEGEICMKKDDIYTKADDELVRVFERVLDQLESFNKALIPSNVEVRISGIIGSQLWEPINKLGAYVPGGLYPYPSTVLMTAGLAKRLGVKEVVVATPPKAALSKSVASALVASNVDKVVLAGGAHGIAALAYLEGVHKIVGPGGPYVQAAKVLVSSHVPIDMVAGPTELAVLASTNADPEEIAYDMLAQAEHGPLSFAVLVTDNEELANRVKKIVETFENDIEGKLYYTIVDDVEEGVKLISQLAPEHVSLYVDSYKLPVAGAVSANTPSPLIDYASGANHVLPTSGWARARGPLSPVDFFRWTVMVKAYPESKELFEVAIKIANMEGMRFHETALKEALKKFH